MFKAYFRLNSLMEPRRPFFVWYHESIFSTAQEVHNSSLGRAPRGMNYEGVDCIIICPT